MADNQYKNDVVLPGAISIWSHLITPRKFKGKGDPRFDVTFVLPPELAKKVMAAAHELAKSAFDKSTIEDRDFHWPVIKVEKKRNAGNLTKLYPNHGLLSAKAYEDNPPQVLINNPAKNSETRFIRMPKEEVSVRIFNGAQVYGIIDLATYDLDSSFGVRAIVKTALYTGAGEPVSIGNQKSAEDAFAAAGVEIPEGVDPPLANQPSGRGRGNSGEDDEIDFGGEPEGSAEDVPPFDWD